ncbi:ANTAR domain-containing response regulator [Pseudoalteromonas sp. SaAl2]
MHRIEKLIAEQLTTSAEKQIKIAKRQLHEHKNHIKALSDIPYDGSGSSVEYTFKNGNLAQHRLTSNRTFYDLIVEQSEHLKQMNDALQDAKQVISEQKTLNRAKLILIQHLDINEEQAHKRLQKQAMDQQCSLFEVAKHVLKVMNKDQHIIGS